MPLDIQATGKDGREKRARRIARQIWNDVKTPSNWNDLTAAERWEDVRKFMKYMMLKEFRDDDNLTE